MIHKWNLFFIISISLLALSNEQIEIDLIPSSVYAKKFASIFTNDINSPKGHELFLANIKIGKRLQPFHLLLDTTSYPMWIQSIDTTSKVHDKQVLFKKEVTSPDPTQEIPIEFNYGVNKCKGEIIEETVSYIKDKSAIMKIPLIKNYSTFLYKVDGIVGMSRPSIENDKFTSQNSLIPSLFDSKEIETNIFSIHHFINETPKLFIGKEHEDFSNKENVSNCQVSISPEGLWECKLTQILHNNTAIIADIDVVFDTSVEKIYFPDTFKPTFKKIISKTNCREFKENHEEGTHFDCITLDDWLPFAFAFSDSVLKFPQEMLEQKYERNQFHLLKIVFSPKYQKIHFGTSFFKYYHVLFNPINTSIQFYAKNKDHVGTLKDFNLITKSFTVDFMIFIAIIFGFIITALIIIKVIQSQLKKNHKNKWQVEEIDESKYIAMKTIKRTTHTGSPLI